jgi:hypothetical protein
MLVLFDVLRRTYQDKPRMPAASARRESLAMHTRDLMAHGMVWIMHDLVNARSWN